jgi:CRISPR-associated endonuclease/helicase Cas3
LPGPQIVILNTVQSAAVVAKHFCDNFGRDSVEHLSTALTPNDREITLKRVKERLSNRQDCDWTLVATSCVEAGVDLSFHTGFRELASLTSLLQAAGRVNRNGEYGVASMFTFCLAENEMLKSNLGLKDAASVLRGFIEREAIIEPLLVTKAIESEIKLYGMDSLHRTLLKQEAERNFPFVNEKFNVIDTDSRITVIDDAIVKKICSGHINWRELQRNSLQVACYKLRELHIPQIVDGIYHWNLEYDKFIGYMSGVIEMKKFDGVLIV